MKTWLFLLFAFFHWSVQGQSNTLTVHVSGFSSDGLAYILLYEEGQDFGSKSGVIQKGLIKNQSVSFTYFGVEKGKYALMVFHDQNENGKLDTNFLGMPKEGVGNSNNHRGIPSFRKCQFEISGDKEISISMVYL